MEFAIIAPLLLVLLLGGAQVAVIVYAQVSADTAAREGARTGGDNPLDSQLFPAATSKDCTGSGDARKLCVVAFKSTSSLFGLIDPTKFTVKLSSQQYPAWSPDTALCAGATGTADDGLITVQVSYQAPVFVPFLGSVFADSGKSYRTVTSTVIMRVSPCSINGGH